MMFTVC